MENLTSDVSIYINNEIRLLEIKAENDVILKRVKRLESRINRLKQQGKDVRKSDESMLNALAMKSLYLLAKVDTLKIVGNGRLRQRVLHRMIQNRYFYLVECFKRRLFQKRFERLKHVECLHHIDFNIIL